MGGGADARAAEPAARRLAPESVADGYAVQDAVAALNRLPQRGWKIDATNAAARVVINIAEPVSGRLYAPFCHDSRAELSADAFVDRQGVATPIGIVSL